MIATRDEVQVVQAGDIIWTPAGEEHWHGASVDTFVGDGYGIPTPESTSAIELAARTEALFLDPTYTAKAMAGLIARVRGGHLRDGVTLFWHTGGQVGLFA